MGTDAILISRKKKQWCDIGRMYNWQDNREEEYTGSIRYSSGCSPEEAIKVGEYNKQLVDDNESYTPQLWSIEKGIKFLKTLDKDDVVKLLADSDDEHDEVIHGPNWWKITAEERKTEWVEWKDKEDRK